MDNFRSINNSRPQSWKADTRASVDLYNSWFMKFAPEAFRSSRINATKFVEKAFQDTNFLKDITVVSLRANPGIVPILRMSACPPLAVDRLSGLADVPKGVLDSIEKKRIISKGTTSEHLSKIIDIIDKMLDRDIFPWLEEINQPNLTDVHRSATIVADRYCGALTNPIIRNAQEIRQLNLIENWLKARGYVKLETPINIILENMPVGSFAFRMNVPVKQGNSTVNLPVDVVVKPLTASSDSFPLLIEAKSAGDFTNVNKRRKEEAQKFTMLKNTYGPDIQFVLFLCGYFDASYLGYSAAEGLDWVWEHRIEDLEKLDL